MINPLAAIREFLVEQDALTDLTDQRIYAGVDLPAGYSPADGEAILFNIRGGDQAYHSAILSPSVQFSCYAETDVDAMALAGVLFDCLNDKAGAKIARARQEDLPKLLPDPQTGWPRALVFYDIRVRNP